MLFLVPLHPSFPIYKLGIKTLLYPTKLLLEFDWIYIRSSAHYSQNPMNNNSHLCQRWPKQISTIYSSEPAGRFILHYWASARIDLHYFHNDNHLVQGRKIVNTYFKGRWLKPLVICQKWMRRHPEASTLSMSFRSSGYIENWNSWHIVCTSSSVQATRSPPRYSRLRRSDSEFSLLAGEAL